MARILLAEDDEDMRRFLTRALEHAGYQVVSFSNGRSAYDRLREEPSLLVPLAEVYARSNPGAEEMVEVQVIHRRYELDDGRSTGEYTDDVVVRQDLEATP